MQGDLDFYVYRYSGLEPGKTYTFRVRYVDADGNKGKISKPLKHKMLPCWVFNRFWETHKSTSIDNKKKWITVVRYRDFQGDEYGPMPKKWKIKNTLNCDGVNILTTGNPKPDDA